MKERTKRQKAIIRRRIFISCVAAFLATCIAVIGVVVNIIVKNVGKDNDSQAQSFVDSSVSSVESTPTIDPNEVVASATVVNIGDIILHSTVLDGAKLSGGEYDFSAFFKESARYFNSADLATANLEVTLGGKESGAFSGYPAFNAPDSLLDVIKNSGINLLTTANNHCYDTGLFGLKRTVQQLKAKNIDFIGTKEVETDPEFLIKEVNGIKLGITTYTYENPAPQGQKSINGNIIKPEANALINSFNYNRIDEFYTQAQSVVAEMESNGAEAVVFYMHWGEEYQLQANTWQKSIAQKLCNMGVDVIVGGHPHVIQPIELIHSEDSQNTTVCIYSMGNAISNQRQEIMDSCPSGHTEDGMMFYYSFQKFGDGRVELSSVDIIPTWVNKYPGGSGYQYTIYPIERNEMINSYGFNASELKKAKASYQRTKELIAKGLSECQQHLGCEIRFSEQVTE